MSGGIRAFLILSYAGSFEQTAGIEFLRMTQDLLHGSLLDAYSLMHNEECVTKLLRARDVMADEEKRKLFLFF